MIAGDDLSRLTLVEQEVGENDEQTLRRAYEKQKGHNEISFSQLLTATDRNFDTSFQMNIEKNNASQKSKKRNLYNIER